MGDIDRFQGVLIGLLVVSVFVFLIVLAVSAYKSRADEISNEQYGVLHEMVQEVPELGVVAREVAADGVVTGQEYLDVKNAYIELKDEGKKKAFLDRASSFD